MSFGFVAYSLQDPSGVNECECEYESCVPFLGYHAFVVARLTICLYVLYVCVSH